MPQPKIEPKVRLIAIDGTSGDPRADHEFKQALRIEAAVGGFNNLKEMIYYSLLRSHPDLEPYIQQQLSVKQQAHGKRNYGLQDVEDLHAEERGKANS